MDGEKRFLTCTVSLVIIGTIVAYLVTLVALWSYRLWIALSFFALLIGSTLIFGLIKTLEANNERALRKQRVHFHYELPLDRDGVPLYLPGNAQPNPGQQYPPYDRSVS